MLVVFFFVKMDIFKLFDNKNYFGDRYIFSIIRKVNWRLVNLMINLVILI